MEGQFKLDDHCLRKNQSGEAHRRLKSGTSSFEIKRYVKGSSISPRFSPHQQNIDGTTMMAGGTTWCTNLVLRPLLLHHITLHDDNRDEYSDIRFFITANIRNINIIPCSIHKDPIWTGCCSRAWMSRRQVWRTRLFVVYSCWRHLQH